MAIIVDSVALVYLVYITYDEYTGKPLGLRPAKAKLRLIFLDLFFIVFVSANLSLAFNALSDCKREAGKDKDSQVIPSICAQQKALASVLLIELIAWLLTFAISVLRYGPFVCGHAAAYTNGFIGLWSGWFNDGGWRKCTRSEACCIHRRFSSRSL